MIDIIFKSSKLLLRYFFELRIRVELEWLPWPVGPVFTALKLAQIVPALVEMRSLVPLLLFVASAFAQQASEKTRGVELTTSVDPKDLFLRTSLLEKKLANCHNSWHLDYGSKSDQLPVHQTLLEKKMANCHNSWHLD